MDSYKTVNGISEGYLTEQKSKFLSFAVPVQSPEQAKEKIDNYRKHYYDARHVCWAYMLGAERLQFRTYDDGEPSSTAGKPILGVINSQGLTDILIVVVRYFGGIKLGTSGLTAAYRAAAQDALENAQFIEKTVDKDISFVFEYPSLNGIMRIIKEDNIQIISQKIDMNCEMTLRIRESEAEKLRMRLSKLVTAFLPCTNN